MKAIILASTAVGLAMLVTPPVKAQNAAPANEPGLSDIVVTANRREESLQSVPVTVTALSAQTLADTHATKLSDIVTSAPSLQILPVFTPNIVAFAIRGQSQQDTVITLDPSVGVYSDEVYIARAAGALLSMVDLERVEVLNGPQGSLFGRNTTGGAVVLTSKKPTPDFEGWVSARYEEGDQFTGRAVINLPIVPDLAELRLVGEYLNRGGFAKNTVTGNSLDHDNQKFVRGTLELHPSPDLEITFRGDYTIDKAGGIATRLVGFAGGIASPLLSEVMAESGLLTNPDGRALALNILNAEVAAGRANPYEVGADSRIVIAQNITQNADGTLNFNGANPDPFLRTRTYGGSGTVEWNLDRTRIRSITAYRNTTTDAIWLVDGSRFNFNDPGLFTKQHQFSQEVIANGDSFADRLNWSVGAQYFREAAFQAAPSAVNSYLQIATSGLVRSTTTADVVNSSFALFGQGTMAITPELKLTAGGRYTWDSRRVAASNVTTFLSGDVCSLPGAPAGCLLSSAAKFKNFTYNLALNYEFASRRMVYARMSSGYRSGGFNARLAVPESLLPFGPEKVTEIEVGVKAQWFDNRLRTNIAYFRDSRSDIQVTVNGATPVTLTDPLGVVRTLNVSFARALNAGIAKVNGIEAAVDVNPIEWLTLSGNWVHMWSRYNSQVAALPFTETPLTPHDSFTISAAVRTDLVPDKIGLSARMDYSYRSSMLSGHFIGYNTKYDVRTVLNANLELKHKDSGVSLAVFGRNLTDSRYLSRTYGIAGLNFQAGATGDPRSFGMEIKVPFGAASGR